MKKLVLATALLSGSLLGLQDLSFAHGGTYRGPGDTVPPAGGGGSGGGPGPSAPGPSGPSSPGGRSGPAGPSAPGQAPGAGPTTGGGGESTDLDQWSFWWEFNKEPYLALKSKIQSGAPKTGTSEFFLGRGEEEEATSTLAPTPAQIHDVIVPALKAALANESNNDILTGAMIALAKIGDAKTEGGTSEFEDIIKAFLADKNQEISETAAVSLGILANANSIDLLKELLNDTEKARREYVKASEVSYRTRSFAAYGLGLIGAQPDNAGSRPQIIDILAKAIESDSTRSRDLKVACIISMGLVPIQTIEGGMADGEIVDPSKSRVGQLQYLMNYLDNQENEYLVRAHCPTAMARLVSDAGDNEVLLKWKSDLAADFVERSSKSSKERNEVIQSSVIGLGLVGNNGKSGEDVLAALMSIPDNIKDQQSRNYSMIGTAKAGGTKGSEPGDGLEKAADHLMHHLEKGKSSIQPWAGLAIGVLGEKLAANGIAENEEFVKATKAMRTQLEKEGNKARLGAYAIAAGMMKDVESQQILMDHLAKLSENTARGYVAVALGLLDATEAKDPLKEILAESQYKPELLKQTAVALGLLGDREVGTLLIDMLKKESGYATLAALSSALGFIGDTESVKPLVDMLQNKDLTDGARGFAAVALGIVADKELLPWNSKIAEDLNYRASTSTLVDSASGTGILDIL